jgi:ribosomal protein S18 acetylase RimI-like enzyme
MRVERATIEDLDRLVDLWIDLAAEMREHDARVRAEDSRGVVREELGRALVADRVHVGREEGTVVGFVSHRGDDGPLATDGTRALVTYAYVVPDSRGEGVGAELFEVVERDLEAAGYDEVALEVLADNEGARRFYRRLGYEPHRLEVAKSLPDDESDNHSKEDA